ncbi:serine hydroxymethyltransferase family protein [Cryptosporidium muris RN66]|uniref:glycine hydroxymethyltransferase n=1 Tax=Cryptosporidium muris (strain RN66) TaxID=441375 RepID=B6AB99_CRYMR|nr:serine hydroxymethyltransferase family protein [Cryptosporidium muris RN66]EEA05651.1 serine hydroxymethyltransferase family protein [Cryptosporidium muris RN66]|eukprot:XP_002140000.1 serine hydroxymethyltransferase family protein [Cryptosporidium muris RN66]
MTSTSLLNLSELIKEEDPEVYKLIKEEEYFQIDLLNLHPADNIMPKSCQEVLRSILTNKYSEGYPGARYYGGTDIIDKIEMTCINRVKKLFRLENKESPFGNWNLNVQGYSGSTVKMAICMGSIELNDHIMTFFNREEYKTVIEKFYHVNYYSLNSSKEYFDMDDIITKFRIFKPKIIFIPSHVLPKAINFEEFKIICDEFKTLLVVDISETAIFYVYSLYGEDYSRYNPFRYADVIYSNTQSSLGGPKGGILMVNSSRNPDLFNKINSALFPGLQGGPHNHQICAFAVQLQNMLVSDFSTYSKKIIENAQVLAQTLLDNDIPLLFKGTDNHMVIIDCNDKNNNIPYVILHRSLNWCGINHSTIYLNESDAYIRFGTYVFTARGGDCETMRTISNLIARCIKECQNLIVDVEYEQDIMKKIIDNYNLRQIKDKICAIMKNLEFPDQI